MKEIRIHGRGGQGAVTMAEIIVYAAVMGGKSAACFPYFGFEKKGGAVTAFVRIDDRKIREKNQVYEPNCVIVIDPTVMAEVDVFKGVKEDSVLVLNAKSMEGIKVPSNIKKIAYLDANKAALEIFGKIIPNTLVLGAFVKATDWVDLKYVTERTKEIWGDKNVSAVDFGYNNVNVEENA